MAAAPAAIMPRIARCPNTAWERRASKGSSTIKSVPNTVRMISGRIRAISALAGIRAHLELDVVRALLEDVSRGFADRRKEALRVRPHPDHHRDKRDND